MELAWVSKYSFALIPAEEVVPFWNLSPHATVFTHPDLLSRLSNRVDWWLALKGNEPLCLWPVTLPDGNQVDLPNFTYWVGPMWSKVMDATPAHSWLALSTEVYQGFIRVFVDHYGAIVASLPLGLLDIRVFDWWNYHAPEKPRIRAKARYTARLYNLQDLTARQIEAGYRPLRRRELRRVTKAGFPEKVTDWTPEELNTLYADVMRLQGIPVLNTEATQITALAHLARTCMGEVVSFRDAETGNLVTAVVLLLAKGVANMVLNLTSSPWRGTGLPTLAVHTAILAAKVRGADAFDFNGANSPTRGDDKHSYGAAPKLYFNICYPG